MRATLFLAVATFGLAACATEPLVMKERTMMTPAEIAEMGLECKRVIQTGTNMPKDICATKATWAAYERKTRLATEELLAEARKLPNAGRFNRN